MAIYFVFVDGIGLGESVSSNPLNSDRWAFFNEVTNHRKLLLSTTPIIDTNKVFKPIDATLGVEGLPQSGTGQVSLFTGVNAAKEVGKHYGPYPHSGTKPLLKEYNLVKKLSLRDLSFYFMNAYPPVFFTISEQRDRWSTTTLMCRYNNRRLNTIEDVINENAITAEITQEVWNQRLGLNIPAILPNDAAGRMITKARTHDLVLYEYYLTDKAGHEQNHEMSVEVLRRLDVFLMEIFNKMSDEDLLILTSDHGNIEDLRVKTHTRNPVPLLVVGHKASVFADAESIVDVVPLLERYLMSGLA